MDQKNQFNDPRLTKGKILPILDKIGKCVHLISIDKFCEDISIGLYEKNGMMTVWTFAKGNKAATRIQQVQQRLIDLGELSVSPVEKNKLVFGCGEKHISLLKFLLRLAVEKPTEYQHPQYPVKDLRSDLMLGAIGQKGTNGWEYILTAQGEAENQNSRFRAITKGLMRYGGLEQSSEGNMYFSCKTRHDKLFQMLLPIARNIRGVEDELEADAMRGQMTTGTLGFSPPV